MRQLKLRAIPVLILVMIFLSCAHRVARDESPNSHHDDFNSGLTIENRINRGTSYIDSLGNNHNIRYIPISITNDSTVSISVQIAFSEEYSYPHPNSDAHFKLIPLSKEWALDGIGVTQDMITDLPSFIAKPVLTEIIEPGDELVFSIGSLYPNPAKVRGVLPRTLFVQGGMSDFDECEWFMENDRTSNQEIPLGLKVEIGEYCMIIPCGSMSYLNG